jgi:uncharacterized protein (DUF1499 family)
MAWEKIVIAVGCAAACGVLTLALLSLLSRRAPTLGLHEGKLKPCSSFPNSVSSYATDDQHAMEPLHFNSNADSAWDRLKQVLVGWPRTLIVAATEAYLRAECDSLVFRFRDDLEFLLDHEAKVIHFRAAARVGYSDLGVNRRRMEAFRQAFGAKSGE